MSALLTKSTGLVPVTDVDLSDKEGYLVKESTGNVALNDSATAAALGVVLEGNDDDKQSTVGVLGAFAGTCRVKLSGTVTKFNRLQQAADGTLVVDAGTGNRVLVGIALESGVSGDLIEAALFSPRLAS